MDFTQYLENPFLTILVVATFALGVGRLSRVITWDAFPPSIRLRELWVKATSSADGTPGPWGKLFTCFWCLTPWLMLGSMAWFAVGMLVPWIAIAWWVFWGWLALSYLSSMLIARDEPPSQ